MSRVMVLHVAEGGAEGGVYLGPGSPLWRDRADGYAAWLERLPPDSPAGLMLAGLIARVRRGETVRLLTPDIAHPVPYAVAQYVTAAAGRGDVRYGYSRAAFLHALHRGAPLQGMVAAFLRAHGISAYAEPYTVVPQSADAVAAMRYAGRDVLVRAPRGWVYLEVKGSSRAFHSPHDYPAAMGILDTASSYDAKADDPPLAYVLVSRPTGGMIVVPYGVPVVERVYRDSVKGIRDRFVMFWRRDARGMDWLLTQLSDSAYRERAHAV